MPDNTCRALSRALIGHLILLFRDQDLTPKAQLAFCEQFGDLGGRMRKAEERPEGRDAENIMLVTNVRENGVPIGSLPDGEMFFHHDKCYAAEPDWARILYALEVTRVGGHTLFANMYEAWKTLSADLKEKI